MAGALSQLGQDSLVLAERVVLHSRPSRRAVESCRSKSQLKDGADLP